MTATPKDTIYIDIDDEITSIVEKVQSSDHKIVALVLPKRATMLQSIVNMKLLKRSADEAKKKVVLITSEASLLPLAGAVGLHVAKNLQSKPAIPQEPRVSDKIETIASEDLESEATEPEIDRTKPIGELAAAKTMEEDVIQVDNDEMMLPEGAAPAAKKAKSNKKLKIPNFEKFRLRVFLGVAAFILLIIGWYFASFVLPKARITIKTDTTNVNSNISLTASTAAQEFDQQKAIVPAQTKELKKDDSEKAPATGQKDVGNKATGTVRFVNCSKDDKLSDTIRTVPAGTVISASGLTFITNEAVQVSPSGFNGDTCKNDKPSETVAVTAGAPGDKYNLSARSYTVSNFPLMTANGSDMSGGTTKLVKVVSQQDIDNVKQRLTTRSSDTAKQELKDTLKAAGLIPIEDTFTANSPTVTSTPKVNEEAAEVTVMATTTYSMLGIREDNVKTLVEEDTKKQIDTSKQSILENGLSSAVFRVTEKKGNDIKISVQTLAVAGPQLDQDAIKKEVAGKKRGDTQTTIQNRPGVRDVTVDYSPFWVTKTPKNTNKITVIFEQAKTDANGQQ